MTARPCLDCGAITSYGSRCKRHARTTSVTPAYYKSKGWQKLSRLVIARDQRCAECGATTDLTADHIVPRSKGGADSQDNLRAMCRRCNSRKGARV